MKFEIEGGGGRRTVEADGFDHHENGDITFFDWEVSPQDRKIRKSRTHAILRGIWLRVTEIKEAPKP